MGWTPDADYDKMVYADWIPPLLDEIFGGRVHLHHDLYELTHRHRVEHNGGASEGSCTAWPSPPARAPLWHFLGEILEARHFLEIGGAIGYTAALMADAGGVDARVDTIEVDPVHADLAENELERKGLIGRVRVLRGDRADVLQELEGPYDVVFSDEGQGRLELGTMVRPGGVLVDGLPKRRFLDEALDILALAKDGAQENILAARQSATRDYRKAVARLVDETRVSADNA